jgi:glycerol uptake facilitator-like aquaporin
MIVRRALMAELVGSMLLAATVIGSGIMAERLAGGNVALALLANTGATMAVLAVLIALFAPFSGAHFNPAVTLIQAMRRQLSPSAASGYIALQIAGCVAGALLAHAMFDLPLLQASTHVRTGVAQWLSEGVATGGLILVVLTSVDARQASWRLPASGRSMHRDSFWRSCWAPYQVGCSLVSSRITRSNSERRCASLPPRLRAMRYMPARAPGSASS